MFANAVDSNVMLRLSVKYVACYKKENGWQKINNCSTKKETAIQLL